MSEASTDEDVRPLTPALRLYGLLASLKWPSGLHGLGSVEVDSLMVDWGPSKKDPTTKGTIFGSPTFGNPQ